MSHEISELAEDGSELLAVQRRIEELTDRMVARGAEMEPRLAEAGRLIESAIAAQRYSQNCQRRAWDLLRRADPAAGASAGAGPHLKLGPGGVFVQEIYLCHRRPEPGRLLDVTG